MTNILFFISDYASLAGEPIRIDTIAFIQSPKTNFIVTFTFITRIQKILQTVSNSFFLFLTHCQ